MGPQNRSPRGLQNEIFRSQALLICALVFFLSVAGIFVNMRDESRKRDQNLLNVAEAVACSPLVDATDSESRERLIETFDTLHDALHNIDVISVVGNDGIRRYHTNHELIGKAYDGVVPDFANGRRRYAVDGEGPSGAQRRAFAAIVDDTGAVKGFVLAVILRKHIRRELLQALATFTLIALAALFVELAVSYKLSARIKERLLGFEPDAFSAMYKVRDGILESLEEGVIAADSRGTVQFMNSSAARMLGVDAKTDLAKLGQRLLSKTVESGERETNVPEHGVPDSSILMDRVPIREGGEIVGAVGVLHDRTEYVKLAEDLSGARFLVDSMRANNHDFTNKLHVILGLLQMKEYDKAASYIEQIAFVQREGVARIARAIDEPALAALIIGKTSKAAELNVRLVLQEGSGFRRSEIALPSASLVTIVGNLIDNALDAMNADERDEVVEKELLFGIHSQPGALLITVDDNGPGISSENLSRIFEKGFTTKGNGHGSGLYQVKRVVESLGGELSVESTEGVGTSFSVSFHKKGHERV